MYSKLHSENRRVDRWLLMLLGLMLCGCGGEVAERFTATQPMQKPTRKSPVTAAIQHSVVPTPSDEPVRQPATVEEAAAAIDLSELPLAPGAEETYDRRLAMLRYAVFPSDFKTIFAFVRQSLLDRGCQEVGDDQTFDPSSNGFFRKKGFFASISVYSHDKPGHAVVRLQNHGNVNLAKLPVPAGAERRQTFPTITSFVCDGRQSETTEQVRKLLLESGWQPYGARGHWMRFKKNAVLLEARAETRQSEQGRTVIDFTGEQMSADLPAPPAAEQISYDDEYKRLRAETVGTPDGVLAFYKQVLAPALWQPTTESRVLDPWNRSKSVMMFRNPAQDRLTLTMRDLENNKTDLDLKHHTASEAEDADRRSKRDEESR